MKLDSLQKIVRFPSTKQIFSHIELSNPPNHLPMGIQKIEAIEENFWLNNKDFNLNADCVPLPDNPDEEELEVVRCDRKSGFKGYFIQEKTTKERIVLHFTVGNVLSDTRSLTDEQRGRVSVPFVLARDGRIYRLFSSTMWSYHLGKDAIGGNTIQSKASIGIEISNYGGLKEVAGNLETAYSRLNAKKTPDIYCSLAETHLYHKLDEPYRGFSYFASYTDAQYESLIKLLRYLTAYYQIPRAFLPESIRYELTQDVLKFRGICSHVNFRKDKSDIGPAFDWARVIKGLEDAPPISARSTAMTEDHVTNTRSLGMRVDEPEEEDYFKPVFGES